ncbi:MAG: four helix bundle protein [Bacteroidetes bacterium]|nr:four helix bundle protein [Bacteroidota bacterium]
MEFTKRYNLNRGYMKLEVWQDSIQLFKLINKIAIEIPKLDFKLKAQILDAAQSISSNIAEGYCRKSLNEYLYFLNVALGSCGEFLTRTIGLKVSDLISQEKFEEIDTLHYAVENKLLSLVKALELKRKEGSWDQQIHEPALPYNPFNKDEI